MQKQQKYHCPTCPQCIFYQITHLTHCPTTILAPRRGAVRMGDVRLHRGGALSACLLPKLRKW